MSRYIRYVNEILDTRSNEFVSALHRMNEQNEEIEDLRAKLLRAVEEGCEWKRKCEHVEAERDEYRHLLDIRDKRER